MPSDSSGTVNLIVDTNSAGLRLDQFLTLHIPDISRTLIAESLRSGDLVVDGQARKCAYRLRGDERISGRMPASPPSSLVAEAIPFTILYEDDFLLVVAKPPGLVVHPGNGNQSGTLAGGLLHYCATLSAVGDALRPGLVHRLDKDTSGALLVAKDQRAHRLLVAKFQRREMRKEYLALAHGTCLDKSGRIEAPIGRHPVNRQKMAVVASGRQAVSLWRVEEEFAGFTLLRLQIETGRTHQIRVHLAHIGHPVVGDQVYGRHHQAEGEHFPRQMLHAERLAFSHPISGQEMLFTAPLWPDFQAALDDLRRNRA
ncbi:MAG: RluA family pseudouridine synthase [Desulfobulbaceae bacterium]|jgi:23S rRNA pseudouridine1911/1915/1917 synthase|nr:RluA family pseudouridine synthase [Desulfobulbaceae bacterium]